jgi:hypothetical protein
MRIMCVWVCVCVMCDMCVCVCMRARTRVCVWRLLSPSFLARALLEGVVLWLTTSRQMSAGIHLP